MAYSTDSRFNSAIVGQMMVGADVDIYEIDSTPKYPVGQGFERSDGARFRYAHVIAPSSTYQQPDEPNGVYPGSAGSRYVLMTLASASADQYAGGYLSVTDDNGEGYTYRIRGNDATDTTATGKVLLSLYDKLQVALTATTDVAITGPMYANLEAAGTDTDGLAVGVSCASLTATDPYGWIQTRGIATVLCDTAGTAGNMAIVSQSVAGSYRAMYTTTATGDYPTIGYIVTPGDSSGHGVINLMLE